MPLLMAGVARRALCAVLIRGVQRRMHALQLASWLRYGDAATLASVSALSTLRLWAHDAAHSAWPWMGWSAVAASPEQAPV